MELPHYHKMIANELGVTGDMLDEDEMSYNTAHSALGTSQGAPDTYNGRVLRIITNDAHTGYATLICERNKTEVILRDLCKISNRVIHKVRVDSEEEIS